MSVVNGASNVQVFISYSWSNESHKQWVVALAERLMSNGVLVVMDIWDLKHGHDKYAFMEKMVKDPQISKVLVICDKAYRDKADARTGGVGTESQLISAKVYESVEQSKFIPILSETDEVGQPYLPTFMASRMYCDLSDDGEYEAEYDKLLRTIYDKPEKMRPPLGPIPAYLTDGVSVQPKSALLLATKRSTFDGRDSALLIGDYFDQLLIDLETFRMKSPGADDVDSEVMLLIEQMRPLRDGFISFATTLAGQPLSSNDVDALHDNLERLAQLQFHDPTSKLRYALSLDQFKFFVYEVFICLVAVFVRRGRYSELGKILSSTYFYRYEHGDLHPDGVNVFNEYVESLDSLHNRRMGSKRISITADFIKQRCEGSGLEFDELIDADLLVHYASVLNGGPVIWFPRLSVYAKYSRTVPVVTKMISKAYFERVKCLFGVDTLDELKLLMSNASERATLFYGNLRYGHNVTPVSRIIDFDKVATIP
ncbi:MAG: toll/interleukin-1 receptor domain-containing protein [Armatimonadetes bacterium]|nr:toll/interleukin-1 receptor domain-containing protein [Armatimonadota bacterium]